MIEFIKLPIDEARSRKWDEGQKRYGKIFVGHPLINFDEEMLDALNYCDEAQRWGYDLGNVPQLVRILCERVRRIYQEQKPAWGLALRDADEAAESYIEKNGEKVNAK